MAKHVVPICGTCGADHHYLRIAGTLHWNDHQKNWRGAATVKTADPVGYCRRCGGGDDFAPCSIEYVEIDTDTEDRDIERFQFSE